jgi:hypothetical protein
MAIKTGAPIFFWLWGVPFVLVGIYMTIGRFFYDRYVRARTFYAVTSDRVLIVSKPWAQEVKSLELHSLGQTTLRQGHGNEGTLTFGSGLYGTFQAAGWPATRGFTPPAFERVPEAAKVLSLIREAQRRSALGR